MTAHVILAPTTAPTHRPCPPAAVVSPPSAHRSADRLFHLHFYLRLCYSTVVEWRFGRTHSERPWDSWRCAACLLPLRAVMAGGTANWARALTRAAIVIGTGVVLLKSRYNLSLTAATTPNEQQMYDVGALFDSRQNLSPDLKRSVDAQRHAHERAAQSARIREQQSEVRITPLTTSSRRSRTRPRPTGSSRHTHSIGRQDIFL